MNKLVFLTFRNFSLDGGGKIRIYGILNALAKEYKEIILISNISDTSKFHPNIKHIFLNLTISTQKKNIFQFSLAIFPNFINKLLFFKYLKSFSKNIPNNLKDEIIFFEYLDNSFGYFLKRNKAIGSYVNDIHGIAPLEFYNNKSKGIKRLYNLFRYIVSKKLDYKVMKNATKIIAVSKAMKKYFLTEYPFLENKIMVIPDGVSKEFCSQKVDDILLKDIIKTYKNDNKKIILFAGDFKDLGGVLDLVNAFIKVIKKREDVRLLLIGDGEHFNRIKQIIQNNNLKSIIHLLGRVPYNKLKTYQELADMIVCPDRQHPYSNLIIHIKYFDSLASGKVVINGSFISVKEINKNKQLSIDFEPSNINDLADKISLVLENLEFYKNKYKFTKNYICKNFTYDAFIKKFLKDYKC